MTLMFLISYRKLNSPSFCDTCSSLKIQKLTTNNYSKYYFFRHLSFIYRSPQEKPATITQTYHLAFHLHLGSVISSFCKSFNFRELMLSPPRIITYL